MRFYAWTLDYEAVLRHAQALQKATSLRALMEVARAAVEECSRFRHTWLAVFDPEDDDIVRVIGVSDAELGELILEHCPVIPAAGDLMIAEIRAQKRPVIVLDASIDQRTNKDIVLAMGNRTIVNVPVSLGSELIGMLGVGTFSDEGIIEPDAEELEALLVFATQLAAAFQRVTLQTVAQRVEGERHRLARLLDALQRTELMGVLASSVAHDLNNLLTVILISLSRVDGKRPEVDRRMIADSREAADRCREVVQRLLALGSSNERSKSPVDISRRVRDMVAMLRPTIPPNIEIRETITDVPTIAGDSVLLDQAVANLVLNARDAVGDIGEISIAVGMRDLDATFVKANTWAAVGTYVRVAISDSGPGVPTELKERIFDPLFTTKLAGTGLGLALVAQVADQHAGMIHCDSPPGRGATFELFLPAEG